MGNIKTLNKNIKNENNIKINNSFKTYFLKEYTPKKKKRNNEDILKLLNINTNNEI